MKEVTCQYESYGYEVEDLDSEKSQNAVFGIILKRCEDGKLFMTLSMDEFKKAIVMRLDTLLSSFEEVIAEEENDSDK